MVKEKKIIGKISGEILEGEEKGKKYEFEVGVEGKNCAFYIDGKFWPVHEAVVHLASDGSWVRYITHVRMPTPEDGSEAPWIAARRRCSIEKADLDWSGIKIRLAEKLLTDGVTVNGRLIEGLYEIELFVTVAQRSRSEFKIYLVGGKV